ncbi:MAG: GNAT family N-acetyltransferase, partial [Pseudomonadota bacterium]
MALNTATDISISLCTTREAMQDHVEAWQALMPHVAEDNINYAPAPFFALLDANGAEGVSVAFIWRDGILIGVWPLQFGKAYHTPIQHISTYYDSSHMMSSVPLLRLGHTEDAVYALLNWIHEDIGAALFSVAEVTGKSDIARQIDAAATALGFSHERYRQSARAILQKSDQAFEDYFLAHTSGKRRNALRRKRKKLASQGDWQLRYFGPAAVQAATSPDGIQGSPDWRPLLDDLIQVEAKSWKAAHGSAIALNAPIQDFILALCDYAAQHDQLYLIAAYLDDKPIAAQLGLINDHEIMIYKLGFDEDYKSLSPGLVLMYDMVEHAMHAEPPLGIDSCGDPKIRLYSETLHQARELWKSRYATPAWRARALHRGIQVA